MDSQQSDITPLCYCERFELSQGLCVTYLYPELIIIIIIIMKLAFFS